MRTSRSVASCATSWAPDTREIFRNAHPSGCAFFYFSASVLQAGSYVPPFTQERWQSGLMRLTRNQVCRKVPGVRIPPSPPGFVGAGAPDYAWLRPSAARRTKWNDSAEACRAKLPPSGTKPGRRRGPRLTRKSGRNVDLGRSADAHRTMPGFARRQHAGQNRMTVQKPAGRSCRWPARSGVSQASRVPRAARQGARRLFSAALAAHRERRSFVLRRRSGSPPATSLDAAWLNERLTGPFGFQPRDRKH